MFLLLKSAIYCGDTFEIVPVPRNAKYTADNGETEVSGDYFIDKIKMKSDMLKPDIITDEEKNEDINIVE